MAQTPPPWRPARDEVPPAYQVLGAQVSQYSLEMGELICRRLEAGESLRSICKSAGLPSAVTVLAWRKRHPDFGQAVAAARRKARAEARGHERAVAMAKQRGKDALGHGRHNIYTPQLAEAICERIAGGESLTAICADPGMPTPQWVYKWLRIEPDFADAYAQAREAQAHAMFDAVSELAARVTNKNVAASRLVFDMLRWQAARLAPKKYGERLDEIAPDKQLTVIIRRFGDEAG